MGATGSGKKSTVLSTVVRSPAIDRRFFGPIDKFKTWAYPSGQVHKATQLSSAYTFYILDLATNTVVLANKLDPADEEGTSSFSSSSPCQFQFEVAPQSIEFSEPAATHIIPTQDGGKFVESHGSIFKDLRISGTSGFRPHPVSNEVIPGLRAATSVNLTVPGPLSSVLFNDDRGLHFAERTGFDDMIFLRNLFRQFWDWKSVPALARRYVMVWISAKESEAWVVEPINFTMSRDSSSPLTYKYQIQCRTLYPLDVTFSVVEDRLGGFLGLLKSVREGFQVVTSVVRGLTQAINQLADLVSYVANLPFDIAEAVIGPALEVVSSIASVRNSFDFGAIADRRVRELRDNCRNAFEIFSSSAAGGSTATGSVSPTGTIAPPASSFVVSGAGQDGVDGIVRNNIKTILRAAETILGQDFLWTATREKQISDYSSAYNDAFGNPPLTGGSPLNISGFRAPEVVEEKLLVNESIRSAAKRLLGDEAKWKQLVIMNDLRFPYISIEGGDRVLQPGDPILVPAPLSVGVGESNVPRTINSDENSESLSPSERRFGRDLVLQDSAVGAGLADLVVNSRGDLDVVEGPPNVEQAIKIKFNTEQGELATHPTFGAKYPLGEKFPGLQKFQEFSLNTRRTIRQDPRVKNIEKFAILIDGTAIRINASLSLRGADVELPLSLMVRS